MTHTGQAGATHSRTFRHPIPIILINATQEVVCNQDMQHKGLTIINNIKQTMRGKMQQGSFDQFATERIAKFRIFLLKL